MYNNQHCCERKPFFRNVNLIKQPNKQTIVARPAWKNNYLLRCVAKEFFYI